MLCSKPPNEVQDRRPQLRLHGLQNQLLARNFSLELAWGGEGRIGWRLQFPSGLVSTACDKECWKLQSNIWRAALCQSLVLMPHCGSAVIPLYFIIHNSRLTLCVHVNILLQTDGAETMKWNEYMIVAAHKIAFPPLHLGCQTRLSVVLGKSPVLVLEVQMV